VIDTENLEKLSFDPIRYNIKSLKNDKFFCAGKTTSPAESWLIPQQ
jgi:hypothetical protein